MEINHGNRAAENERQYSFSVTLLLTLVLIVMNMPVSFPSSYVPMHTYLV